jgi:NADPH:quinone reductase-like Zn-dependent oxidoreductase
MSLSIVALPREIIFFALFALIFSRCIAVKFTSLSNHQTMPSNTAAWLQEKGPLEVKSAPYSPPQDNEIVVKNCAVAINPVDWMKQEMGNIIFSHVKYPFVMGNDTAGEVVEVGTGVTRFKVGDRVVGHAVGMDPKVNRSAEGAFQTYTVLRAHMTSPIPSTLSYENAAVIPLGLSTAACGLFEKDQLALPYPSAHRETKTADRTILIWGGSTSVGSCAIQLAIAAGYEVITTCSPRNFDYVKKLGASQAFDYNKKSTVDDIVRALQGKIVGGAMSIGHGAADACLDILGKCNGDKALTMASYPMPATPPKRFVVLATAYHYLSGMASIWFKSKARRIRTGYIFGSTLVFNGVGKAIYEDYLPEALAEGAFVAAPDSYVVGTGLEYIQPAFEVLKKGVSAKKLVVLL